MNIMIDFGISDEALRYFALCVVLFSMTMLVGAIMLAYKRIHRIYRPKLSTPKVIRAWLEVFGAGNAVFLSIAGIYSPAVPLGFWTVIIFLFGIWACCYIVGAIGAMSARRFPNGVVRMAKWIAVSMLAVKSIIRLGVAWILRRFGVFISL